MDGETELAQGTRAGPEAGREDSSPTAAESTTSLAVSGPNPQPESTVPASHAVTGVANPSFMDEPPPYSPPDPKTAHLLYLSFQPNIPGQGPTFHQPPAPALNWQPTSFPGSSPLPAVRKPCSGAVVYSPAPDSVSGHHFLWVPGGRSF